MKTKKIKVFLGGYVNFQNAQNLNCKALSEHLNKEKFKVSTILFPFSFKSDFTPHKDVRYIKVKRPVRLFRYWAYLKGISSADIAFLPKREIDKFCLYIAKIFRTKTFTTLEGVLDDVLKRRIGENKFPSYINHFSLYEPNLFSITKFLATTESKRHNLEFVDDILYLGVDSHRFLLPTINSKTIKCQNIIFIGNDPIRKNIADIFFVSQIFPDIKFHIVGGNKLLNGTVNDYIRENRLSNVKYHGPLDHTQLASLLSEMDLMYFPSRSEGFPKVHLETACAGVPTLCYGDYGAAEWIKSWKNGIIVNTRDEAIEAIHKLQDNPELLRELSINAIELGKSFDWNIVIKNWEKVIERIVRDK